MGARLLQQPVNLPARELARVVQNLANKRDTWWHRVQRPQQDRWWTRLYVDESLDVWLLTWLPGHVAELHDHGPSSAAFTVVRGTLEETRVTGDSGIQFCSHQPGRVATLPAGVVHDVRGAGDGLAVSIHAYSPALTQMHYYEWDNDGQLSIVRHVETDEPEQKLAG